MVAKPSFECMFFLVGEIADESAIPAVENVFEDTSLLIDRANKAIQDTAGSWLFLILFTICDQFFLAMSLGYKSWDVDFAKDIS